MPILYIISGPPGIGKSTEGRYFFDEKVEFLNHDALWLHYKNKVEPDYENLSDFRANEFIQEKLKSQEDFGIEINLGYENHYELLKLVKNKYPKYHIYVCLFYTNDQQLCIDRANKRHQAGGHFVAEEVIKEMYQNTIPLVKKYAFLIDSLKFVDVNDDGGNLCFDLNHIDNQLFISDNLPQWLTDNFEGIVKLKN